MTQKTEIRYSKSSIEHGTNDTEWTHVQQHIITSAEANTSEYRQEPNRTKSPEDKHPGP